MNIETIAKPVLFKTPERQIPRTKYIWYEGSKYYRTATWHGQKIYIIQFHGVNKMHIEIVWSKEQYIAEVDDCEFEFKEAN